MLRGIFAGVPQQAPTVDVADIDGEDGAELAAISTPGQARDPATWLRDAQTYSEALRNGTLRQLDAVTVLHASAAIDAPASLLSALNDLHSGRVGLVVPLSTLYDLHRTATNPAHAAATRREQALRALQLLRHELAAGRAILVSAEDELRLRAKRGYLCPDWTPWNTATDVRKKFQHVVPSVLVSAESRAWAPWDHMHAEVLHRDVHYDLPWSHKFGANLVHVRRHASMQDDDLDEALFLGDVMQFVRRVDAATVNRLTDPTGARFDPGADASTRVRLWAFRNRTPEIDQRRTTLPPTAVPEGRSRGALNEDVRHIGVYTPDHPQR
jgi:hypothetical protein